MTEQSLPGAPQWIDLMTSDTEKAKRFYSELFGWDFHESGPEFGGYVNATRDGKNIAGLMQKQPDEQAPDAWSVYLLVEDAAATAAAATAGGGQVLVEPMDVGDMGRFAVITDPGGAVVGMWQNRSHTGIEAIGDPGTPAWFEVLSKNYSDSVDFYRDVFGWETSVMSDTDEFRYSTLGEGDDAVAGIMDAAGFLPEAVPSHWSVYFAVSDTDAAIEAATSLGGQVLMPAEDTAFGRIAHLADDQGSSFKLAGPVIQAADGEGADQAADRPDGPA